MADYSKLQDAIDAGITNMTCHRNNTAQDDGTDTIPSGPSWFHFNGSIASTIYASGNSWLGLGASSEQMKVNRRDCKMFYLYSESGTIGRTQFFKIRWRGQSHYSDTSDAACQQYDVFLLSTGQIYLNYYDVPTNNCSGTNALVCGSESVSYSVTAGTACEYTFTASNPTVGTGWSVAAGKPDLTVNHKTYGKAEYVFSELGNITSYKSSSLSWTEDKPEGTSITVSAKVDDGQYLACTNGGTIPCLQSGGDYTGKALYVLVELATTVITETPCFSAMHLVLHDADDDYLVYLTFPEGNVNGFQNAVGDITVSYRGGTLMGRGGPVLEFSETFTPEDLTFKGHQNDCEHIEVGLSVNGNLMLVAYNNTKTDEHIDVSLSVTGTLTDIRDI